MRLGALLAVAAACGRVGFDHVEALGDDDTGDGGPRDTGTGDGITGSAKPNRVFVTRNPIAGTFGTLAAADSFCNTAATNAGIPGMYVAWLSTTSVDAITRLAGSRGWVRTDGVPVVDQPGDLGMATGKLFSPIDRDESGAFLVATPWTGTGANGKLDTQLGNCSDWTSGAGTTGWSIGGPTKFTATGARQCTAAESLFCFEVGHVAVVTPQVVTGNIAFVSTPSYIGQGVVALDNICTTDASGASLPGMYRAAVATSSTTIASRFTTVPAQYVRPDGTLIATGSTLLSGGDLESFVDQRADGSYGDVTIATGGIPTATSSATCSNWVSTSSGSTAGVGFASVTRGLVFWSNTTTSCNAVTSVLCLQL